MKLRKFLCVILSVIMLAVPLMTEAFAYTCNESWVSLKSKFKDGETIFDYVYYSPVKDKNDSAKYPLIVWLHGNKSGDYKRHQLNNCLVAYWACEGAQSQFNNGGAFLFLPRHDTIGLTIGDLAWDGQAAKLKKCVDMFIEENKENIDPSRIYVGGYSMGGKGAFKQISEYPGFYAAGFLLSPVYTPVYTELTNLKNTPVWVFSCAKDYYPSLTPATMNASWNQLCSATNVPDKIRRTTFEHAYYMDGSVKDGENHNSWDPVISDLFKMGTTEPFDGMKTVDGNGNNVEITYPEGFIYWLNSQTNDKGGEPGKGAANKIIEFFNNLIVRIVMFFKNLFK